MIKPPHLKNKDLVAIVAPSSRPARPSDLRRAVAIVESMGLRARPGKSIFKTHGFSAGTDQERLSDLVEAFTDDEVRAVWSITGGYGALPLLPQLPYESIKKNPKLVIGFDDFSHLSLAVHVKTGLVTLHGPNLDKVNSKETFERVKRSLTHCEYEPLQTTDAVLGDFGFPAVEGLGKGKLIAANLTALVSLFGTEFEPDLGGAVLVLDDYKERNDILDRWFNTLYLSGKMSSLAALALGCFDACDSRGAFNMLSFEELAMDRLIDMGLPSCFNLPSGNGAGTVLALGVDVSFDSLAGRLTYLESVLSK